MATSSSPAGVELPPFRDRTVTTTATVMMTAVKPAMKKGREIIFLNGIFVFTLAVAPAKSTQHSPPYLARESMALVTK